MGGGPSVGAMSAIFDLMFAVGCIAILGGIAAWIYALYHSIQFRRLWWQDTPSEHGSAHRSAPLTCLKLDVPETATPHGRKARTGAAVAVLCWTVMACVALAPMLAGYLFCLRVWYA